MLVAALLFSAATFAYNYGKLPDRVASHFNAPGHPDGWSTKLQFISASLAVLALVTLTALPISLLAYFAPSTLINLPNKEYWLTSEREAETRRTVAQWGLWFTAATLWLLALLFHQAVAASFRVPPRLESMWWLLAVYLMVVSCMVIQLVARFWRKPPNGMQQA
jgi:uncharacterized membrane protein